MSCGGICLRSVAIALLVVVASQAASAQPATRAVVVAGGGTGADGSPATEARLDAPFGVDRDSGGRLLIIDYAGRLRAVSADGKITTLCGGTRGDRGDGGPAGEALLNAPHALAVGPDGGIYIADTLNHRVRRIDARTGVITSIAGTTRGFSGDGGPAAKAQFSGIYCIAFSPDRGKLVITDLDNCRIRVMDMKSAVVTTVAGTGARGLPVDGEEAVAQPLVDPRAAAMDSRGNLYILERAGHALRVVDARGRIRTLIPGPARRGDPRILSGPKHLAIDARDDVIIADTDNHRIVRWRVSEGKLVPVAGTGKAGSEGVGGPIDKLQLNQPHGVFVDNDGTLYISDSRNGRVLRIEP